MRPVDLFALALTLSAYGVFQGISGRLRRHPMTTPLAWAVAAIILVLELTRLPYQTYFEGARFVHFLLGPATVALAVPLYEERERIRRVWKPLAVSLLVGGVMGVASSAGLALLLGAPKALVLTLAPKSVTTPIAMQISERVGGLPALTAAMVVTTGIFGAVTLPPLFRLLRRQAAESRGFAMGMAAHGVGTARALEESNEMGAFAGLAIGLNGLMTAILVPLLARLLGP